MKAGWLVLSLLLSVAAQADVPYRKKLLTAAELRPFLPKGFQVDDSLEHFETSGYRGVGQYDYKYRQNSILFLKSAWAVRSDPVEARAEYSKLVLMQHFMPTTGANWSSRVHVGDENLCLRLKGGRIYTLCFRQAKYVGYFALGLQRKMSPKDLEALATNWIRRAIPK